MIDFIGRANHFTICVNIDLVRLQRIKTSFFFLFVTFHFRTNFRLTLCKFVLKKRPFDVHRRRSRRIKNIKNWNQFPILVFIIIFEIQLNEPIERVCPMLHYIKNGFETNKSRKNEMRWDDEEEKRKRKKKIEKNITQIMFGSLAADCISSIVIVLLPNAKSTYNIYHRYIYLFFFFFFFVLDDFIISKCFGIRNRIASQTTKSKFTQKSTNGNKVPTKQFDWR